MLEKDKCLIENKKLQARIDELQKEKELLERQLNDVTKAFDIISNSTCWKVTYPVRVLLDNFKTIVKTNRISLLIYKGLVSLKNDGISVTMQRTKSYIMGEQVKQIDGKKLKKPRIKSFVDLLIFLDENKQELKCKVVLQETIKEYDSQKVVPLISHECSLTGAPVVLFHLAKLLKEKGFAPVLISPKDGKIIDEFTKENIPTILYPNLYFDDFVYQIRKLFEFVVANTIISGPIIKRLLYTNTPVIWWIHEAIVSYSEFALKNMPDSLTDNIFVYAGGNYARDVLLRYRPNYKVEILLYHLPDFANEFEYNGLKHEKYTFACIGTLEKRKAQNVLAEAIELMNPILREKCKFIFVGKNWHTPIKNAIIKAVKKFPEQVSYIDELSQSDLKKLYACIDCLVCTSVDDPMPVVITDFLCLSKQVVCYSKGVGTVDLLVEEKAGVLYDTNSPEVLKTALENVVLNNITNATNLRRTYEKYFSLEAFENAFDKILIKINDFRKKKVVSNVTVVIPSFNAEKDFKELLPLLKKQININDLEIVVVDSGSTDATIEICKKYDVKLIEITQQEFSHSYSRNLGARSAKNPILVFMTQDARPTSEQWLSSFVKPLFNDGVVAVCCKEKYPQDVDFYYKVISNIHSLFVMGKDGDRIADITLCENKIDLRQNGNLNDVANAVRKDIFSSFEYRFDYAEDLDLGIRLLRAGYRIAFLTSVEVLHGHNRSADYYMKRSIVEVMALDKILEQNDIKIEDDFSDILTAYVVISNANCEIRKQQNIDKYTILQKYGELLHKTYSGMIEECFHNNINIDTDTAIVKIMVMIFEKSNNYNINLTVLEHLNYFYEQYVYELAVNDGMCNITDVCNAMKKHFAVHLGSKLAHIPKNSFLYEFTKALKKGI